MLDWLYNWLYNNKSRQDIKVFKNILIKVVDEETAFMILYKSCFKQIVH